MSASKTNATTANDATPITAEVGQNVALNVSADRTILTITIDLTQDFGPSSSGKTRIVASTKGNIEVPGKTDFRLGLNLFRK
jgi:hypothetical protein